ncbi:MAG: GTPase Era [Propionibacteriaceae bacterium]|nr:GTPase Era [Propionibacteriaceae bacterium]
MTEFRSGYASITGRPNAGKSTLLNALVGEKVAIASDRPETTRHAIRGILTRPEAQLVLVDTPGLHKPRTLLGERLNAVVRSTWSEVDVVAVAFPSNQRVGPGDRHIVAELAGLDKGDRPHVPRFVALATKTDLVSQARLAEHLLAISNLPLDWADIVPVSALTGDQVDTVADVLFGLLEPGPMFYPDGETTDEPEEVVAAELIREACLGFMTDELPHSIAVTVDELRLRPDRPEDRPLLDVFASIVVERDSQRPIVLGARGSRLRDIGIQARRQLGALFGLPVHLDLRVKVLKDWQGDARKLRRLGF